MLSTHPESSLQTGKSHPPRGSGFTCVFLLSDLYLLDVKVEVYCALFIIKQKFVEVNPEWPVGLDLPQVTGCNVCGSPLPWKLTAKFPLEIVVLVFLFHPASSGMSFPSAVQIRDVIKMDNNVKMKSEWKKELRLFWHSLSSDVKCKNSNSCLAEPLSPFQEREKCMTVNQYPAEI